MSDSATQMTQEPADVDETFEDAVEGNETEYEDADDLTEEEKEDKRKEAFRLKDEGNQAFKQKDFETSIRLYSEALDILPKSCSQERAILFSNRAAAKHHLDPDNREDIISDCSEALNLNPSYLKPLLKRAEILREMGEEKLDDALADWKKITELEPQNRKAREAVVQLEREVNERNEHLKEEMLSKLKDLGNLVLRPFGLSTDNFKLNPNESGGYSVDFKPS